MDLWEHRKRKMTKQNKMTTMKKYLTNYRFWILTILIAITTVLLLCVPIDNTTIVTWFLTMLITKGMGIITALLAIVLFRYWASRNELECLTDLLTEE